MDVQLICISKHNRSVTVTIVGESVLASLSVEIWAALKAHASSMSTNTGADDDSFVIPRLIAMVSR